MEAVNRLESMLESVANGEETNLEPKTRLEFMLASIANGEQINLEPKTRLEWYLKQIAEGGGSGGGDSQLDALIDGSLMEVTSNAKTVTLGVFYYFDRDLEEVNLPEAIIIKDKSFLCANVKRVKAPKLEIVENYAFSTCNFMEIVDVGIVTEIGTYTFNGCWKLKAVVLRSETLCSLTNSNAFYKCYHLNGTVDSTENPDGLKDGYIYVPKALIEEYKVATNWSTYASQFRALEDYTIDGTITGELDESKI